MESRTASVMVSDYDCFIYILPEDLVEEFENAVWNIEGAWSTEKESILVAAFEEKFGEYKTNTEDMSKFKFYGWKYRENAE